MLRRHDPWLSKGEVQSLGKTKSNECSMDLISVQCCRTSCYMKAGLNRNFVKISVFDSFFSLPDVDFDFLFAYDCPILFMALAIYSFPGRFLMGRPKPDRSLLASISATICPYVSSGSSQSGRWIRHNASSGQEVIHSPQPIQSSSLKRVSFRIVERAFTGQTREHLPQ